VLVQEAHQGYPLHLWLAVGHLAEASDELLRDYPGMAEEIRSERLNLMTDKSYCVPFMELLEQLTEIDEAEKQEMSSLGLEIEAAADSLEVT
jgi:hypothetical protein